MSLRVLRLFPLLNAAKLNPATPSFFTLQITSSREWSRRAIAHSQTRIPAQYTHRTTHGIKSIESRYILYLAFYLTFQIFTAMIVVILLGMPK